MFNDDTVFDEDFLVSMVSTAEKHPNSAVGSLLLLWDTPHRLFQVSPQWDVWSGGWRHWQHQTVWTIPEKPWKVDLIVGNCVLIPADAFAKFGLMDSKKYPNFGDAEFTPRLRKNGWNLLIDPKARAFCQPNDLPVRIKSLSLKEKFRVLFTDLGHVHNLRRRFYACTEGGPSYIQGVAAYLVFLARLFFRRNVESSWAENQQEPPLSRTYAEAVME